jgi:lipopolysaccharide biosynthesis regulator YciM
VRCLQKSRPVTSRHLTTPTERSRRNRLLGLEAAESGSLAQASDFLEEAVAADPSDDASKLALAGVSIARARYEQAVALLESIFRPRSGSHVAQMLAQAYLGVGDERNAERVLRTAGFGDAVIAAQIKELRAVVKGRSR